MSVHRGKTITVVWGSWTDDPPEEAILITRYANTLSLTQEDRDIHVAYRDVPELLREMRACAKEGSPQ